MGNRKLNVWEEEILKKEKRKTICKHNFVHVSQKGWWGCQTIIYCKKCGMCGEVK